MEIKVACIQTTSGDDIAANIAMLQPMLQQAVQQKAQLIALPENVFFMRREGAEAPSYPMEEHPGVVFTQQFCASHKVSVLIGSLRADGATVGKPLNRAVLVDETGAIAGQYDKIHLFDVVLPSGEKYQESLNVCAGSEPVVAEWGGTKLGLSICYDLRFAAQYRAMAKAGAEILTIPAAFTQPTGKAHWHTLIRARAIENLAYAIAPAQCGTHPGGRTTYGHSLIVGPWGEVLAEAGEGPEVITAMLEMGQVAALRAQFPVLERE
jgi:deaminated glutathione amidase